MILTSCCRTMMLRSMLSSTTLRSSFKDHYFGAAAAAACRVQSSMLPQLPRSCRLSSTTNGSTDDDGDDDDDDDGEILPLPLSERFYLQDKHDPDEIRKLLEDVNERLADCQLEGHGKYRGRASMHARLRKEAPSNSKRKRIRLKVAWVEVKTLLYRRHALQHGGKTLKEFSKKSLLAKTFLGRDATAPSLDLSQAKQILAELWRHGKSLRLEHLQRKNEEKKAKELERKRRLERKQKQTETPTETTDQE